VVATHLILIIDVYETNIDFDLSPRTTYCRIGGRLFSPCINGHSGSCAVVQWNQTSSIGNLEGGAKWNHQLEMPGSIVSM
jgi:hypothetical protein